jgi:hypothetical protein
VKNRISLLFLFLLLAAGLGCSDKPNKPDNKPEPYYKLIYSYVTPEFSILTFNSKTGEVLDSAWYPKVPYWDLVFSKDAARAYYSGSGTIWITDIATGDTIAIDRQHATGKIVLAPDEKHVVTISARSMTLFSLPNLETVYQKSATSIEATFHPSRSLLYFFHAIPNTIYQSDTLFVLDYASDPVSVRAVALKDSTGELVPPGSMVLSADGRWMLSIYHNWVFLTEVDSLKVRHAYKSLHFSDANYKGITLHPDGKRAFLAYYDPWYQPDVGGLDVFDFETLTLYNYLDRTTISGTDKYFRPEELEFSLSGDEIFGVNSQQSIGSYDLFKIEAATKKLSLFTENRGGKGEFPAVLRLNPKPYYK